MSAKKLSGHSRYTFIAPGNTGFANVDPEAVQDIPLFDRIAQAYESSEGSFSYQVRSAARAVNSIMDEEDPNGTSLYHQLLNRMTESRDSARSEGDFLLPLTQVLAFSIVNSTSWAIVTKPTRAR